MPASGGPDYHSHFGRAANGAREPVDERSNGGGAVMLNTVASPNGALGGGPGPTAPAPSASAMLASFTAQRAVIRKAIIAVRVTDVEKADKALDKETDEFGGYVDSANSTDLASDTPQMDVTVRVPVSKFDLALGKFEALGVELSKSVNSEDVTGQIVDLDARLRTLGAEEETYRNILRKTTDMSQVIQLQDKLTEVRTQMESMSSQRKTLGGLAALSTIQVHLERSAEVVRPSTDPSWLSQTWGESTTRLGSVLRTGAVGGIWFLVFCPLLIPVAFVCRWSWRAAKQAEIRIQQSRADYLKNPPV
jgi:hypothetical protein